MKPVHVAWIAAVAMGSTGCQTTKLTDGGATALKVNPDCPLTQVIVQEKRRCEAANCPLWVQVITNQKDGACEVVVEASELRMAKRYRGPDDKGVTLNWWIPRSPDIPWEFQPEAGAFSLPVNFKDQGAPGLRDQFSPGATVSRDRSQVDLPNSNSNSQTYNYKIKVFKKGASPPVSIESRDPAIINDF